MGIVIIIIYKLYGSVYFEPSFFSDLEMGPKYHRGRKRLA